MNFQGSFVCIETGWRRLCWVDLYKNHCGCTVRMMLSDGNTMTPWYQGIEWL